MLSSPQMLHLAIELKERYPDRLIIYDLPPILTVGDAIGFLPSIDATLLVVRDGRRGLQSSIKRSSCSPATT